MPAPTATTVRFSGRVSPTLDALVTVRDALSEALHGSGWSQEDAFRVLVCADEAIANAISHGDAGDESIDVRFHVDPCHARIAVRDHHAGAELPSTESAPDESAEHGRGLILMRALADRFRVHPSWNGTSVGLAFRATAVAS